MKVFSEEVTGHRCRLRKMSDLPPLLRTGLRQGRVTTGRPEAQADLKPPVCSRGRGFIWGERSVQSQDLEMGVVREG